MAIRVRHEPPAALLGRTALRVGAGLARREDWQRAQERQFTMAGARFDAMNRLMMQREAFAQQRGLAEMGEAGAMKRQQAGFQQAEQMQEQQYDLRRQEAEEAVTRQESAMARKLARDRPRYAEWETGAQAILTNEALGPREKERAMLMHNANFPDLDPDILEMGVTLGGRFPAPDPMPGREWKKGDPLPDNIISVNDNWLQQDLETGKWDQVLDAADVVPKPMTANEIESLILKRYELMQKRIELQWKAREAIKDKKQLAATPKPPAPEDYDAFRRKMLRTLSPETAPLRGGEQLPGQGVPPPWVTQPEPEPEAQDPEQAMRDVALAVLQEMGLDPREDVPDDRVEEFRQRVAQRMAEMGAE